MADPPSSSSSPGVAVDRSPPEAQTTFANLPDDVAVQCLARVPRSNHPSLSLVCKSWISLLRSPLFHSARRSLFSTDFFLYLNIRFPPTPTTPTSFNWFYLDTQTNPKPPICSIPSTPSSQPIGAAIVSLNSKIYVIGGSIDEIPTPGVWILDSLSNRWEAGPEMRVAREFAAAGVINGKIYVIGGCTVNTRARTLNWSESFDPDTQLWSPVPSPDEIKHGLMHASAVVDGKIYAMADRGGVLFDPAAGEWSPAPKRLDMGWRGRAAVVGGVLYCYDFVGKIRGFDVERNVWMELKGVEKDLPKFLNFATMVNVGGKLFVVWVEKGKKNEMEVLCAEIAIERDDEKGELVGSMSWCGVVLVVPSGSIIVNCLAVEF